MILSVVLTLIMLIPPAALAGTRALLVACSDFVSQPDLGSAISGNLHMIGSALLSADTPLDGLSIEDGTIASAAMLSAAAQEAFAGSEEGDLSILYLCTHGVLSSSDDGQVYLLLGDGSEENPLSASQLYDILRPFGGEKLLILDACYSGAMIGRGAPHTIRLPGSRIEEPAFSSPFPGDPSIHVLTSASGRESSWYYNSDALETGAVSYFASAVSAALGLYGTAEADVNGDGCVSLSELHGYLSVAVPSSSSQLLSARADNLLLPAASGSALSRPLTGFSYADLLLHTDDPTLDFSFTVTQENTGVQYRLIDYDNGGWNWENAKTFVDEGDNGDGMLVPGRKNRSLFLSDIAPEDSGYLMLQIFSVTEESILLCSERLIAVQPADAQAQLTLSCSGEFAAAGAAELAVGVNLAVPAELTVSVYTESGALVRRLSSSRLTRPTADNVTHFYWDGRGADGSAVPEGRYTVAAEALVGGRRLKATADVTVKAAPPAQQEPSG